MTNFGDRTISTGDNLDILRGLNSASVDLIYLDQPFNSNRNYTARRPPDQGQNWPNWPMQGCSAFPAAERVEPSVSRKTLGRTAAEAANDTRPGSPNNGYVCRP